MEVEVVVLSGEFYVGNLCLELQVLSVVSHFLLCKTNHLCAGHRNYCIQNVCSDKGKNS